MGNDIIYNVDGSKATSFYINSLGQVEEVQDGKGITTFTGTKFLKEFQNFVRENYQSAGFDYSSKLHTSGSYAVDKNRVNKFLDIIAKKEETENAGGYRPKSFDEYLKTYGGVDTKKQYAENVRQANSDFYRSLMTYGKKAEALAGNGLTSSGMSDYGAAAAYAARQGAVTNAAAIKAQTDTAQSASYAQYLENERKEAAAMAQAEQDRKLSILNAMYSLGLKSDEEITAYANAAGYGDDQAAEFLTAIQGINNANADEEYSVNLANAINSYNGLISNGISHDAAIDSVKKQGYTDENILTVLQEKYNANKEAEYNTKLANATLEYNNLRSAGNSHDAAITALVSQGYTDENILAQLEPQYQGVATANAIQAVKESIATPNYSVAVDGYVSKATLDAFVDKGDILKDSEEYKTMLTDIQNKNAESLDKLIKGAHDEGEKGFDLKKACAEFGITYDEANKETIAASVVEAVRERAQDLYYAGDITEEQYKEYIKKDFEYELNGALDEASDDKVALRTICGTLVTFSDYTDDIEGSGEKEYDSLVKYAVDKLNIDFSTKVVNGGLVRDDYTQYTITVNGKTAITFEWEKGKRETIEIKDEDIIGEYQYQSNHKLSLYPQYDTLAVLKDGRIGYRYNSNGKQYFSFVRPEAMKDYSEDQRDALAMMIGTVIVNKK